MDMYYASVTSGSGNRHLVQVEDPGVYTKISGKLSEEPFHWLIQKFPCILLFKTGQPGRQLNLSEGQIRLDLTRTTLSVEPWDPFTNMV